LQRQAYGYRDLEYFKLKIYDLPKLRIIKNLWLVQIFVKRPK